MKVNLIYVNLVVVASLLFGSCAFTPITKSKDIVYSSPHKLQLDIYAPKKATSGEVFVFIHGGNWDSGKKSQYRFLGSRMARKGIVTVIIDYRLSPSTDYQGMAGDAATAIKWVKENIRSYGGDDTKIVVSGHSAGGHLAALISTDNHYFEALNIPNPIHGTILIDAFGLDMYAYLSHEGYKKKPTYLSMFTTNPKTWKEGSPIYHLRDGMSPFLLFVGGKTYPSIIEGNRDFLKALKKYQPNTQLITVRNKKHVAMISQFLNTRNRAYMEIIDFMKK